MGRVSDWYIELEERGLILVDEVMEPNLPESEPEEEEE